MTAEQLLPAVHIARFNEIIDRVESRCMAADGPVTPTLQEMREDELRALWLCLKALQVEVHRVIRATVDLERHTLHDPGCPAVGAKGDCNCGLEESETEWRTVRQAWGLPL